MHVIDQQKGAHGKRVDLKGLSQDTSTHAGLWLDKGLAVLKPEREEDKVLTRRLFEQVAGIKIPEGFTQAFERRRQVLESLSGEVESGKTRLYEATVDGRLVVGLGNASPQETNITLHHTWGVPVIPGSALKGVAASAAHASGLEEWAKPPKAGEKAGSLHEILFGDVEQAGIVTFHDAWWKPELDTLPIEIDVMTVHHADYYGKKDGAPPADWDSPTPITFATSTGTYIFALSGPEEWIEAAEHWLKLGMKTLGVGAKTAAGYGRMTLEPLLSKQDEDIRRHREILQKLPNQHDTPGSAKQAIPKLQDALETGVPIRNIHEAARKLWNTNKKYWKKQYEKTDDETRTQWKEFGLVPPSKGTPPVKESSAPETTTVEAVAWIGKKKKKEVYFIKMPDGKKLDRRTKRIDVDDTIINDLNSATEQDPLPVRCVLDGETVKQILPRN